ncbi:hypothetical protein ADMFC3_23550 [Geovibrio sp. ADMFC3]
MDITKGQAQNLKEEKLHDELVQVVNKYSKLTIYYMIVAFVVGVVLNFFIHIGFVFLAICLIFIPLYVIAYRHSKDEIIDKIIALEDFDTSSNKAFTEELRKRNVLFAYFWGLRRRQQR